MRKWFSRIYRITALTAILVFMMHIKVKQTAQNHIYSSISEAPTHKVGLLLGTAKHLGGNRINLFYKYRIDAAIQLYKAGKIKFILISGDNGHKSYDEPTTMKKDLIAAGIPVSAIYLDYAGFRTLDSVVRCKKVFGEDKILVISQQFHNERAIFLAQSNDMEADGYNAKDITGKYGLKTHIREYLARTKMFLDIIFGKDPKFLGDKIKIG